MMDRNRRRLLVATALGPLMLVGACGGPPALTRVGCVLWIGYDPLFLARELGMYDPTRLRLVEMPSNTTNLMLLAAGDVEAATLTLDECLLAREGGVDLRVILVCDYSDGGDVVMARPELARLEDLKSKRVGVEETAASALMLAKLLEHANLRPQDIEKVMLTSGHQVDAYRDGEVDAVVSWEPFATQLEAQGARRLFDSRAVPGLIVDVLAVRADALERAPDNLHELVAGYFRALDHLHGAPDDAIHRMAPRLGLDQQALRSALRGMRTLGLADNRAWLDGARPGLLAVVDTLSAALEAQGLLQGKADPHLLADPRFLPGAG